MWVARVGGDDVELRPWHYIYVYSIENRLMMGVRYDTLDPKLYTLNEPLGGV